MRVRLGDHSTSGLGPGPTTLPERPAALLCQPFPPGTQGSGFPPRSHPAAFQPDLLIVCRLGDHAGGWVSWNSDARDTRHDDVPLPTSRPVEPGGCSHRPSPLPCNMQPEPTLSLPSRPPPSPGVGAPPRPPRSPGSWERSKTAGSKRPGQRAYPPCAVQGGKLGQERRGHGAHWLQNQGGTSSLSSRGLRAGTGPQRPRRRPPGPTRAVRSEAASPLPGRWEGRSATAAPPGARSGGAARLEGGSGSPRSMPGDPGLCGPSIPASSPPGQRASVGLRPGPAGAARTPKR